jgi:ribosomal protein L19E
MSNSLIRQEWVVTKRKLLSNLEELKENSDSDSDVYFLMIEMLKASKTKTSEVKKDGS